MFERGETHNTSYFAPGMLLFYMSMNMIGFLFVNVSNMNCSRKSLFYSNDESRVDFVKTTLFSPIIYFFGNNIALRSQHDLSALGESYDYWDCMQYNASFWLIAFIAGLQFTHFR